MRGGQEALFFIRFYMLRLLHIENICDVLL